MTFLWVKSMQFDLTCFASNWRFVYLQVTATFCLPKYHQPQLRINYLMLQTVRPYTKARLYFVPFWVIPRRLSSNCRRFGTHCRFHLHRQVTEVCQWMDCVGYLYLVELERGSGRALPLPRSSSTRYKYPTQSTH